MYSCNGSAAAVNEEARAVDASQVSAKQRKFLKSFNVPGLPQYPGSSWFLTISKISEDIALPILYAAINFIITFPLRWDLGQIGVICKVCSDTFSTTPDSCKILHCL